MNKNKYLTVSFKGYMIVSVLVIVLLIVCLFGFSKKTEANDGTVTTYMSVEIQKGDTLWSIAKENAPENMSIHKYIQEVRRINHLITNDIISGEALIIPIYSNIEFS